MNPTHWKRNPTHRKRDQRSGTSDDRLLHELEARVEQVNDRLAPDRRIRTFALVEPSLVESDLRTARGAPRRRRIEARFAALIDDLYTGAICHA